MVGSNLELPTDLFIRHLKPNRILGGRPAFTGAQWRFHDECNGTGPLGKVAGDLLQHVEVRATTCPIAELRREEVPERPVLVYPMDRSEGQMGID